MPPYSPTFLVCQTRCNVFLPPKIIPAAYMESPRMGPNLPYKPATTKPQNEPSERTSQSGKTSHTRTSQNRKTSHPHISRSRKTSHPHISQIRKTSLPRTTRSSLFPLIIIHVWRYGESSRGPYHPWGRAHAPACACPPAWADEVHRAGQIGRKTGRQEDRKTGRQG